MKQTPRWSVLLGIWVTAALLAFGCALQPVATVIDSSDRALVGVAYSSAPEVTATGDRVYRWGLPHAALTVPALAPGYVIVAGAYTAPGAARRLTIGVDAQPVASYPVAPAVFRSYQVLAVLPAPGFARTSTLTLTTDGLYDDGARQLGIGYGLLRITPIAQGWYSVPTLWALAALVAVLCWGGLVWALGSTVMVHAVGAGAVVAAIALANQYAGDRTAVAFVAAGAALVALVGVAAARWLPARSAQPVAHTPVPHAYRADIDGLRAIAVGVVVMFHAFPQWLPGGYIGVDVFFVISGYLISQLLLQRMQQGTYGLLDFYARRVRRIFPALLVVLLTVSVAALWLLDREQAQAVGLHVAGGAGFVANLQAAAESGYFDDAAVRKPLLHLWSLGIEEQFYLVWPFVMLAALRARRRGWWLIGAVVAASFGYNLATVSDPSGIGYYWPLARVWQFAAGAALAYAAVQPLAVPGIGALRRLVATPWASALAVVGLVGASSWYSSATVYPGWAALIPTLAAAVLIAAPAGGWVQRRVLAQPVMVGVGLISYPLYLWHWPLLSYGFLWRDAQFDTGLRAVAVVASVGLAALTYWCVEQPLRVGRLRSVHPLLLVAAVAAVGGVGWWAIGQGRLQTVGAATAQPEIPFAVNGSDCGTVDFTEYPARYCSFHLGSDPAAPPVYVVGDSHALYLARGFFSRRDAGTTYLRGVYGCVPLLGVETYADTTTRSHDCPRGVAALYDSLATHDPRVPRTIVFAMRYTALNGTKLNPTDSHTIHLQPPGPRVEQTPAQRLAVFRAGLAATLSRLAAYPNTRVIVLYQLPELDFNPAMCRLWVNAQAPCHSARAAVDGYAAAYRQELTTVLARYPQITAFDPTTLVCDRDSCTPRQAGVLWYRDDNHVSVSGARAIITQLGLGSP